MRIACLSTLGCGRRDGYDRPATLPLHYAGREVAPGIGALQIDVDCLLPLLLGHVIYRSRLPDARIRDQDINPAQLFERAIEHVADLIELGDIRLNGYGSHAE